MQKNSFIKITQDANGQGVDVFDKPVAILTVIQEIPLNNQNNHLDIDYVLKIIFGNFHKCVSSLLDRYSKRETLKINDEYDVQNLPEGIDKKFGKRGAHEKSDGWAKESLFRCLLICGTLWAAWFKKRNEKDFAKIEQKK